MMFSLRNNVVEEQYTQSVMNINNQSPVMNTQIFVFICVPDTLIYTQILVITCVQNTHIFTHIFADFMCIIQ